MIFGARAALVGNRLERERQQLLEQTEQVSSPVRRNLVGSAAGVALAALGVALRGTDGGGLGRSAEEPTIAAGLSSVVSDLRAAPDAPAAPSQPARGATSPALAYSVAGAVGLGALALARNSSVVAEDVQKQRSRAERAATAAQQELHAAEAAMADLQVQSRPELALRSL